MNPRPLTLRQVAEHSASLEEFGRHFRDWLHELRRHSSRPQLVAAIAEEPPRLKDRFAGGAVADAWTAAYADHISGKISRPAPAWTANGRVAPAPWFAVEGNHPALRLAALRDSPGPFKARNLFTAAVDLPFGLTAGRPVKPVEEKRRVNAARQRRFQARRRAELQKLRKQARA